MPRPVYRSAGEHKDHVFHTLEKDTHDEKRFFPKQGKRAKLIGAHVGTQLADKATTTVKGQVAHYLADKMTKKKIPQELGTEVSRMVAKKQTYESAGEINEIWGQVAKFAATAAAGTKTARDAAKAAKVAVKASKAGQVYNKMERGSRLRNIKRARLRNSSPIRAFINDRAREATREVTVGAGTDALRRAANHHMSNMQDRHWEKQQQRVQAARGPYQQRRENMSTVVANLLERANNFTPTQMGNARKAYNGDVPKQKMNNFTPEQMSAARKTYGNHSMANAHSALTRAGGVPAPSHANNKNLYKVPSKTKTNVSDAVIARAANMNEWVMNEWVLAALKAAPKAIEIAGNVAAGATMAKQGATIARGKLADRRELKQARRQGTSMPKPVPVREAASFAPTRDREFPYQNRGSSLKKLLKPPTVIEMAQGQPKLKTIHKKKAVRIAS